MAGPSKNKRQEQEFSEEEEENDYIIDDDEEEEEEEEEDLPPTSINPYTVLNLSKTASQSEIKSAYRKLALKTHPDKVADSEKEAAHAKFQELAFAFAILSDERRRKRYDTTGRTEESLAENDDEEAFNWTDFFRAQFAEVVSEEKIVGFAQGYKGGEEERGHLLEAYERFQGDMNKVYNVVMLSDAEFDEERFRGIIQEAIDKGEVEGYKKFTGEKESSWRKRIEKARQRKLDFEKKQKEGEGLDSEGEEDESEVVEAKKSKRTKSNGKAQKKKSTKAGGGMGDLAALIQQRQNGRAENFFDSLEAKYGGGTGRGKKRASEPPEEAFEKNRKRGKRSA